MVITQKKNAIKLIRNLDGEKIDLSPRNNHIYMFLRQEKNNQKKSGLTRGLRRTLINE